MRTVAIIQARMASTRLPGKVLLEAAGKPLLLHMIERLRRSQTLDDILIACPRAEDNKPIWDIATSIADGCWRGDEEDVLRRVLEAARSIQEIYDQPVLIVELTGDCPLLDPKLVDECVQVFYQWLEYPDIPAMDFVTNVISTNPYPRGMDVRVFPTRILEEVNRLTQDPADREHVSLYIWEHPADFNIKYLHPPKELYSNVRLTVDTPEDLELIRAIFEHFSPRNDFSLGEILAFLEDRPDLVALSANVQQKAVR